jgi:tetratricopeptide (TPR) repeat protein
MRFLVGAWNILKYLFIIAMVASAIAFWCYLVIGCDGNETPPTVVVEETLREQEERLDVTTQRPTRAERQVEKIYHNGVKLYNVCEYEDARLLLEEYVSRQADEARPMAYLILGEIERALTNHCGSIDLYERALQVGSPYVRHHAGVNLVYACLRCDKVDRAEEVAVALMADTEARFRKADVGADRDITCARAIVYRRRGHDYANGEGGLRWVLAADEYSKALKIRPDFVDIACDKAWAFLRASQARWKGTKGSLYDGCMVELVIAYDTLNHPRYARFGEGRCADLRVEVESEIIRQWGLVTGKWKKTYKDPRHQVIAKEIDGE